MENRNHHLGGLALLLGLSLAGCTGLTSNKPGSEKDSTMGLVYSVPTTRISLQASVNPANDTITFSASQPEYIADRAAGNLRLSSPFSIATVESGQIGVNGAGLLTTVTLESDGRVTEILEGAAKSAATLLAEKSQLQGDTVLFQTYVDVSRLAVAARSEATNEAKIEVLNQQINGAVSGFLKRLTSAGGDQSNRKFLAEAATEQAPLTITVERVSNSSPGPDDQLAMKPEDCQEGFCYRVPVRYALTVRFFDGTQRTAEFDVPNGSPVYVAKVRRGVFSKVETKATLQNGMLTNYEFNNETSELEEFAKLPVKVAGAFVGQLIDSITLRGKLFKSEAALARDEIANRKAQADLAKESRALTAQTESALSQNPALFQFVAGTDQITALAGRSLFDNDADDSGDARDSDSKPRRSTGSPGTSGSAGASARDGEGAAQ